MTPQEADDVKTAWQRLSRATSYLVPALEAPERKEVGKLVDECRQALSVILLVAGPEAAIDQDGIDELMGRRS